MMLNTTQILNRLNIDSTSPTKAVQEVREKVMQSPNQLAEALKIIMNVTGKDSVDYDDQHYALHIAQGVVQAAITLGDKFDPEDALRRAEEAATKLRNDPAFAWLFGTSIPSAVTTTESTMSATKTKTIAGVNVEIKANGKIKKGGKQEAVNGLLLSVVNATTHTSDMSNQDFIDMLVKHLDMSKQGATTYAYNACKAYKEKNGLAKMHEIFSKSKKSRRV